MAEQITPALQGRLQELKRERSNLQSRLTELDQLEQAIQMVIADEARTVQAPVQLPFKVRQPRQSRQPRQIGQTPKSALIIRALGTGTEMLLGEIVAVAQARGVDFEGKDPGRSLHFALVGLQRFGYTDKDADGRWRLTPGGRVAAGLSHANGRAAVEIS